MVNFFSGRRILMPGILLLFFCQLSFSQSIPQPDLIRPAASELNSPIGTGTVQVIAVMVEFEPDDNRFTSGDGTFELDYLMRDDITIDPLPHDRGYFEAHLEFAKNYFDQASGGLLNLEYQVLPEVYRLPNEMKEYSPTGPDDSENFKLGNLARDVWELVGETGLPDVDIIDPERTLFVIFHAGAGRDIELTGTTLNNTPQDIPSVYLSQNAIGRLLNQPDFDGFDLGNGIRVTNSAILPQTQSRAGEDVTGADFVLELSINGILAANIGSFLGLPDLFNTETGSSGIGRFGLMDGAGIFSYYGLFPPLPSAWERKFMGWDEPFDISLDDEELISLPAVGTATGGTIARHRISRDEYFLVENRHRDPENTGVTLTIRTPHGQIETRTFTNEEDRFNPFDQSDWDEILPPGTLINISNFDWSLPGGLDAGEDDTAGTDDDRILNGGMLIWHIDDAVIRARKDDNEINNDPDRRGIALQEADGAQDIGRPAAGLTNFANGGPFDFWWSGNDFTVITPTGRRIVLYENRFGDDTYPNNRSNTGSPTYFEFYDFTDNIPNAGFRARRVSPANVDLVFSTSLEQSFRSNTFKNNAYPLSLSFYEKDGDAFLIIPGSDGLIVLKTDDESVFDESALFEFDLHASVPVYTAGPLVLAADQNGATLIQGWEWNPSAGSWDLLWEHDIDIELAGKLSSSDGSILEIDGTSAIINLEDGTLDALPQPAQTGGTLRGSTVMISGDELETGTGITRDLSGLADDDRRYAGLVSYRSSEPVGYFVLGDHSLDLITSENRLDDTHIFESTRISWPALIDLDRDSWIDFLIVNFDENRIEARNRNAGQLWSFPGEAPDGIRYAGTPLSADITGDGEPELIVPAADSLSLTIRAYNKRMKLLDGFPLYAGSVNPDDPINLPAYPVIRGNRLYVLTNSGDLKVWEFENMSTVFWGSLYGNNPRNKVMGSTDITDPVSETFTLLNKDETYNWPNPASDHTNIRYQTVVPADIDISIVTMSGTKMYDRRVHARGGVAEEIRIDTNGWGSGVYYARIRANADGQSETRLIKIAIMQ